MKKYLMTGMAALAICAAFTSCSKETNVYNPDVIQENSVAKIQKDYAEAFVATFGQPASNQDWGFGTRSKTRAAGEPEVVKKDMWENDPTKLDGNSVPADVTTAEAAYVYEWFQKEENKGLTEEGRPWTNFFLQQVYGTMDQNKLGIWHRFDQNRVNNGYASNYWDEEFTDKGGMDYLTVGDGTTMTHVLDFNAEEGGPWGIVYMKNSSAMQFGYHGSWDSSDRQLFKLAQITVPGECFGEGEADRTGWYVGLSLLAEKYDNGDKVLGEQRKDWGDDWILKVVPGVTYEDQIRIIAEDLNAKNDPDDNNGDSDWDFNDVVFDVEFTSNTTANIHILAAGGVLPIYVAGTEAHSVFGFTAPDSDGRYPMINTAEGKHYEYTSQPFSISGIQKSNNGKDIEIKVIKTINGVETPCILTAANGQPASKIGVDPSFEWCNERQKISRKYPLFTDWVQTTEPWRWYGLYE
ncbi:MAG: hypothetical protein IKD75_14180 [Prevotella sp.]|nr:hypothetical protein [Prevotella sp.]